MRTKLWCHFSAAIKQPSSIDSTGALMSYNITDKYNISRSLMAAPTGSIAVSNPYFEGFLSGAEKSRVFRIVNNWNGRKLFLGGGGYDGLDAPCAWTYLTSIIVSLIFSAWLTTPLYVAWQLIPVSTNLDSHFTLRRSTFNVHARHSWWEYAGYNHGWIPRGSSD